MFRPYKTFPLGGGRERESNKGELSCVISLSSSSEGGQKQQLARGREGLYSLLMLLEFAAKGKTSPDRVWRTYTVQSSDNLWVQCNKAMFEATCMVSEPITWTPFSLMSPLDNFARANKSSFDPPSHLLSFFPSQHGLLYVLLSSVCGGVPVAVHGVPQGRKEVQVFFAPRGFTTVRGIV